MLSGDSDGRDAEEQVEGGQPPATWVAQTWRELCSVRHRIECKFHSSRSQRSACGGTHASPAGSFSIFSDGRHIASASINVSYYWVSLDRRSTTALNITALVEHNIFTGCSHEACFLTPAVNFSSSGRSIDAGSHFGYI